MARSVEVIILEIGNFQPANGNWLVLDDLLGELFRSGAASQGVSAILGVFERYPTEDGNGVFWSIVHGLESLPGYASSVIESIRNVPSEFALLMVGRMLNAGTQEVSGVSLRSLVVWVAQESVYPELRRQAQVILERHEA